MSRKRVVNIEVVARDGESSEKLIRRFLKKIKKRGALDEYREKLVFEKPSYKKHKKDMKRKRILEKIRQQEEKENQSY